MEQTAISSDLIRGHIDTIILQSLSEGDKFAQQIIDYVDEKSDGKYQIIQATLYSSLKRLETQKYVTSYWNDVTDGRRKFFRVTDLGKSFLDDNLSSWTYSRAIIDKLMNLTYQPVYISAVPNETKIEKVEKTEILKNEKEIVSIESFKENTSQVDDKKESESVPEKNSEFFTENPAAANFRNILNGLIAANVVKKPEEKKIKIEPSSNADKQKTEDKKNDIAEFNEVIYDTGYNAQKSNNNGKIDYGDIVLKAAQEGYKIRISSKDSACDKGNLLINKVKAATVFCVYLLCLAQFGVICLINKTLSATTIVSICLVITLMPLLSSIYLLKNSQKKSSKKYTVDRILTASIVAFNLLLITLAINFLFNVDFSNNKSLTIFTLIPLFLIVDFVAYVTFEFFIAKSKRFNINE